MCYVRSSLTSRHEITPDGLTCRKNQSINRDRTNKTLSNDWKVLQRWQWVSQIFLLFSRKVRSLWENDLSKCLVLRSIFRHLSCYTGDCWLVIWILWHTNLCRSFNAKFCLYIHTYSTKDFKTNIKVGRIFYLQDFICLHKINLYWW